MTGEIVSVQELEQFPSSLVHLEYGLGTLRGKGYLGRAKLVQAVRNGVVSLGNFDGFHGGHRGVVTVAESIARKENLTHAIVTFVPHPRMFLKQEQHRPFLLSSDTERLVRLRSSAADAVLPLVFDDNLASMSATTFVERILVEGLAVKHVVTGENFRFGHRRLGNVTLLKELGVRHGFQVHTELLYTVGSLACSSTRIRDCLEAGRVDLADDLLGHPWEITGVVQEGRKRNPSVPTINIPLQDYVRPKAGVYAAYVTPKIWKDNEDETGVLPAAVYLGQGNQPDMLEAHLLEKQLSLYGHEVIIQFIDFIREDQKFKDFAGLNHQIKEFDLPAVRKALDNYPIDRR